MQDSLRANLKQIRKHLLQVELFQFIRGKLIGTICVVDIINVFLRAVKIDKVKTFVIVT